MLKFGAIIMLGLALLASAPARAAEAPLSADEIATKANLAAYYAGQDGRARVKMTITDAKGGTRTRDFTILRLNQEAGGDQKFFVYFREPADVRKMAYLVWKRSALDKDDDRWLFLPAMDLVRRIAPGDKRSSFVGSDFYYEDVSGRGLAQDRRELLESPADGPYLIKSTPIKPDEVEFASYTVAIDRQTFLPLKAEYFDRQGQKYRVVEALKVAEIQGFPTVLEAAASDLRAGTRTVNSFTEVKYNVGLKDDDFTERRLRRPPAGVQ